MTERVIEIFKEICAIPHGSGNCEKIGEYLLRFAAKRGLEAYKDNAGNVLIKAPGVNESYKDCETVILQGHQDMVCVKEDGCDIDMRSDPLEIRIENGIISARGTSLGADDGIGVAMALAVIENTKNRRPPIEALFTVDEETGMGGAAAFDTSLLRGKKLINLDSEEEGVVTCSCAGGERVDVRIPLSETAGGNDCCLRISVSGLIGGHSGCDIHKGRQNAIRIITEMLEAVSEKDFKLFELCGGRFDNVICSDAYAVIAVDPTGKEMLMNNLRSMGIKLKDKYGSIEKGVTVCVDELSVPKDVAATKKILGIKETKEFLSVMKEIPQGVVMMMEERPESVDTSMNLGTVSFSENRLKMTFSLRSCCDERKKDLEKKISDSFLKIKGCELKVRDPYPAWQFATSSPLRDALCEAYREEFGSPMDVAVTHGGLECGYFASRIEGCEIVSIGPQIDDIHSVKEKVSVDSIERTVKLLSALLRRL